MPEQLRELLHRGAGRPEPSWDFAEVWHKSRRRRRRNAAAGSAAVVAGVSLVIGGFNALSLGGAPVPEQPVAPAGSGQWEPIPDAPIAGRVQNVAVVADTEMIVWGGGAENPGDASVTADVPDGARFDLQSRSWTRIADGPLEVTGGRVAVWTGEEMIVWGGETGDGSHRRPDDGAAYDPARDSWRKLPRSPDWSLADASAVWTGSEMIVWGGVGMENGGAAFDPRANEWRTLAPAPIEGRFRHAAVWTGAEMIVWGGWNGGADALADGAAYNPQSHTWRRLPAAPLSKRDAPAAVWTGDEMIVWGGGNDHIGDRLLRDGAAFDPETNTWRPLPDAPLGGASMHAAAAAWTGDEMVVQGWRGFAAYSPARDRWKKLGNPPGGPLVGPTVVGAEGMAVVWGGFKAGTAGAGALSNGGALYTTE